MKTSEIKPIDDGGPAFSVPYSRFEVWALNKPPIHGHPGMTLRDYFAAQALQSMHIPNSWSDNPEYWKGVAKSAYVCADAMLAERSEPRE
jgi:hypothetical protein